MIVAPLARPSSPSVRFTPLDQAATRKFAQIAKRMMPTTVPRKARSSHGMSRTNEIWVEAGRSPFSSGNCRASTAKVVATTNWPMSLYRGRRPVLSCWEIFR